MTLKLPHWALIALGCAGAVVAYLLKVPTLPAAVLGVLSIAQVVIGLLSGSALTSRQVGK